MTLLAGCSRAQQDWRAAQQAGTPQAYKLFVARHPGGELAGVARQRIAQLTEEAAWQQATRANTAAAYQDYLAEYPNGSWSQDARIRMESQSLAAQAPPSAGPTVPAAAKPVMAPAGPGSGAASPAAHAQRDATAADRSNATGPAARARSAAIGAAGSAVQLGAFSSIANANTEWKQLSSKFRPELRGLAPRVVPVMSSGRRLYRLEAGVASQAAARRLCVQLQQHSQGCLPVP